jgi:hypothetical protein
MWFEVEHDTRRKMAEAHLKGLDDDDFNYEEAEAAFQHPQPPPPPRYAPPPPSLVKEEEDALPPWGYTFPTPRSEVSGGTGTTTTARTGVPSAASSDGQCVAVAAGLH